MTRSEIEQAEPPLAEDADDADDADDAEAGDDAEGTTAEEGQGLSKRAQKKRIRREAQKEMHKRKKLEAKVAEKAKKQKRREEEQAAWDAMTQEERDEVKRKAIHIRKERQEAGKVEAAAKKAAAAVLHAGTGDDGDGAAGTSATPLPPTVVIDLSFDHLMNEREIASLAQQINYSYAANRRALFPTRLALTSLGGATEAKLTSGHENWPVLHEPRSYLEAFPDRDRLVYLSSESETALDELQPGVAYVVGGLVDHNRHKGLTHRQCTAAGVKTARLPIDEHLQCSQRKVLAVNHVVEILVHRASGLPWREALSRVMPERRHAELRDEGGGGQWSDSPGGAAASQAVVSRAADGGGGIGGGSGSAWLASELASLEEEMREASESAADPANGAAAASSDRAEDPADGAAGGDANEGGAATS